MRRYLAPTIAFALLFITCYFQAPALAKNLVIFKSHDYVSHNYEIQHFEDTLTLENGQLEVVPLTMTIDNGTPESPAFKWFRIMVNGEIIATEKDLHGKENASKDVSGLLRGSNMQVQIEAAGVPGAQLWWTLSSPQMELTGVSPQQVMAGKELKLTGTNIPADPSLLTVNFNGQRARIISATINSIVIQVPESVTLGANDLDVQSGKQTSNAVSVMVVPKPVPEILGINVWMAPPGGSITISGRNFAVNGSENRVFFGQVEAQVASSSDNQLIVVVPNWPYGPSQLNIPITVTVDGRRSNSYPFDIGPTYHGAIPQFQPN